MNDTSQQTLASVITAMLAERGIGKTLCPSEVARAIAGPDENEWRKLMKPIRAVAVRMAREGILTIRRKGRIVDPGDFKGIYRLGAASSPDDSADDAGAGAGNSASVRPVTQ